MHLLSGNPAKHFQMFIPTSMNKTFVWEKIASNGLEVTLLIGHVMYRYYQFRSPRSGKQNYTEIPVKLN